MNQYYDQKNSTQEIDIGFYAVDVEIIDADISIFIEIKNNTEEFPATNVKMSYEVPPLLSFQSVNPSGNCAASNTEVLCQFPSLDYSEGSKAIEIFFRRELQGKAVSNATLSSDEIDNIQENNSLLVKIIDDRFEVEPGGGGGGILDSLSLATLLLCAVCLRFKKSHHIY